MRVSRIPLALLLALSLVALSPRQGNAERKAANRAGKVTGARSSQVRHRAKARAARKAVRPKAKPQRSQGRPGARLGRKSAKGPKVVGHNANPIDHLPPGGENRVVFGVMGGAGANTPKPIAEKMTRIGAAIADKGGVVLTGASKGIPDHAVRGARAKGGLTVGISAHGTLDRHNRAGAPTNFDVLQLTQLPPSQRGQHRPNFMGREIDNIERSHVIIVAGGRFGTLGELAIALEERLPVGILLGSGGIASVAKKMIAASSRAGKPPGAPVIYDSNPVRLVNRLYKAKQRHDASGAPRGPAGDR